MQQITEALNWRYATKKFDTTKKVSGENIQLLKDAMQLSASSFGLQPYKIIMVEDAELRAKLLPASWNQTQVTDASHLFVFAVENTIDDAYVAAYFENLSTTRNIAIDGAILEYKNMMTGSIQRMDEATKKNWAAKQAYLAMGNLLYTASLLKIDVTPMEGFVPEQYDEILGFAKKGISSVLVAAIGYRHSDDYFQHLKKVRKPAEQLFETM
jgi:nitroreductase